MDKILTLLLLLTQVQSWCLHKTTAGAKNISEIEYSPDRSLFVTTNSAGVTHLWSATNFLILTSITPASGLASDSKFNKNNTMFGIITTTSTVYIYNASSPYALITTITGGIGTGYTQIDFSYDGNYMLICGGNTNTVKVYNFVTSAFTSFSFSNAYTCKFAANNNIAVAATTSSTLNYYQLDGTLIWPQTFNGCLDLDFDDASAYIVMSCNNGANRKAYAMDTATHTAATIYTSSGTMRTAKLCPDSTCIAYSGDEKILFIVSKSGATYTMTYNFTLDSEAYSSDFSSDSNYLLVGTKLGFIYEYSKYCLDCSAGQYQNLTTLTCQLCSQYNRACGACINSTYCIDCVQGYYLEQISVPFTTVRSCLPCLMEGCIVCNTSTICLRCEVGYYVTSNMCRTCRSAIPGCIRCNSSSICQQCTHDYYLSSNTCNLCTAITGCSLCSASAYCHVCQIGYYFTSGSCTACPTNCLACYNTTTCQDCRQGYYPTNTAAAACSACPTAGCLSCNETGFCYECATNRFYNSTDGSCLPCTYPCSQCINGSVCVNCQTGFYLDYAALGYASAGDGGDCVRCNHPCMTCNSSSYCLSCPIGFYLISASHTCQTCDNLQSFCSECTPTTCLNCTLGYYLNSSNLCTSCTINMYACLSCTSITNCLKCAPGFYLTTNTGATSCAQCSQGCEICNSTSYCLGCIDGFYLESNNSCLRCVPPCTVCISATACIQCQQEYYLNSTNCTGCRQNIENCIACDDETGVIKCSACRVGYFASSGACTACTLPCLACSSAAVCSLCQIGYYLSGTFACTLCAENCTVCTSANTCSSCSIGFFLNSTDNKCYHCTVLGCLTCNSTQKCLSCSPGYYLTTTFTCSLCSSSIKFCQTCSGAALCQSCSFGYTLSTGNISCTACSIIAGCFDCLSLTSCDVCENGYYWFNSSGSGACAICPYGCLTCLNSTSCEICLPGYAAGVNNSCVLCRTSMLGCHLCTSNSTCIQCENGYYLGTSTCQLCRSAMKGCQYCNSSTVCTFCSYGYYLQANNTCQLCSVTLQGCEVCTSSTMCKTCSNGYYLAGNTCTLCKTVMAGCISCSDGNTCLQCTEGYAINSTFKCDLCKSTMPGCIGCSNLSICQQCEAGYYLRTTDKQCVMCTQPGCQVCYETNPLLCVSCNTMYFMSSSRCYYCRDYIEGCIECTSSSICTLCETGYFVNGTNRCQLCQTSLEGCAKCNNSVACYECKSTYYLDTAVNRCKTCLSAVEGCAYCIDTSQCISCSNGYYKNATTGFCELCTNMIGCLACSDFDTCLLCEGDYFLETNQSLCYPCAAIDGCYSCVTNLTCVVCKGGYILNDDKKCEIYKVQADEPVKGMKMISQYLSKDVLSHTLLANKMKYKYGEYTLQRWRNATDIVLQHPGFVMENLTINQVKFNKDNQLLFYTNNPLRDISLNQLPARRRLSSMPQGYKTFLKMKQDMINVILPDLYMSHSLVMDYDLSQPEFYTSVYQQQFSLFQSAIGIVIIAVFTINYVIRAIVTCPGEAISEYGQILPHLSALKAPIFIIYPLFPEEISFCFGFMVCQFPWARHFFSTVLSDKSQTMPIQYSVLYDSLSFASTYLLAFIIGTALLIAMWLYKKNGQKNNKVKSKNQSSGQLQNVKSPESDHWGLPEWPLKMVMYNFFYFGLIFNASASLQNAIYNPMAQISVSAVFTVIGIICFGLAVADALYSLYQNPLYFFKVRIMAKAVILSVSHLSPIYLFSSTVALDLLCMIIQYRITNQHKPHPKLWIYNNIIINLTLALLVFIHSHFVTLIFAGIMVLSVLVVEMYVHWQDYGMEKKRKRFIVPKEFKLEDNSADMGEGLNIWNMSFNKDQGLEIKKSIRKEDEVPEEDPQFINRAHKQDKRNRRLKKARQNLKGLNLKQESMENIPSNDNDNNDNTFVAADFLG